MSEIHSRSRSFRPELLAYAALAACVLLLFARVVGFPFLAFDDAEFILRNTEVTNPTSAPLELLLTPRVGYIVPVTVMVEAALYSLAGGLPWPFHAAALLLHLGYAFQLFAFARRLGARPPAALLAALLFSVHALVLQPVSWAICLKDLLMANLALGATRAFLRVADESPRAPRGVDWLAIVLALLAMLAKPSAVLLGFAWLAYLAVRVRGAPPQPLPPRALACAGVVSAFGVIVALASRFAHDTLLSGDTLSARTAATPLAVLGSQLWHALWPSNLLIVYPDPGQHASLALVTAGTAALVLLAWAAWRTRARPAAFLTLALAVATYVPTSNVLPFGRVMSDSYMYVPLSLLVIRLALCLDRVLEPRAQATRVGVVLAVVGVVLSLAASSNAQLERWRGGRALWAPVVQTHPRLAMGHRLLGDELLFRGHPDLAVEPYRRAFALEYDPRYLLQFGTILSMAGRTQDAECVLIEAVAFGTDRAHAIFNYAALLAFNSNYQSAQPAIAKLLLSQVQAERQAGELNWPPALEAGLVHQQERLRDQPTRTLTWPQRNCLLLRSE